ncbi:hypothetical protein [Pseudomonas sp. ME-P-057]|uniref:hypothetical protein n=1 Tax=Pseudomonas sp. ME-P-057 TaxID=3040321 RepID=UPI0025550F37|nr:hypothetical protein [Pseudomonas sp. ME-P-057]
MLTAITPAGAGVLAGITPASRLACLMAGIRPVGAGLLANPFNQLASSWLIHRIRQQAGSYRFFRQQAGAYRFCHAIQHHRSLL